MLYRNLTHIAVTLAAMLGAALPMPKRRSSAGAIWSSRSPAAAIVIRRADPAARSSRARSSPAGSSSSTRNRSAPCRQHHSGQGDRHRQLDRRADREGDPRGHPARRQPDRSAHAVRALSPHGRQRSDGDGRLSAHRQAGQQQGREIGLSYSAAAGLRPAGDVGARRAAHRQGEIRRIPRRPGRPLHRMPHADGGQRPPRLVARRPGRHGVQRALGASRSRATSRRIPRTVSANGRMSRSSAPSRKASRATAPSSIRRWASSSTPR